MRVKQGFLFRRKMLMKSGENISENLPVMPPVPVAAAKNINTAAVKNKTVAFYKFLAFDFYAIYLYMDMYKKVTLC